jgi:energy-converting hydrogenase A subunit D
MGRRSGRLNELLLLPFCLIIIAGSLYAGLVRDPYVKLIAISLIGGAIMPLIIMRGYLDVASALAVIIPLSTIFILQLFRKGTE